MFTVRDRTDTVANCIYAPVLLSVPQTTTGWLPLFIRPMQTLSNLWFSLSHQRITYVIKRILCTNMAANDTALNASKQSSNFTQHNATPRNTCPSEPNLDLHHRILSHRDGVRTGHEQRRPPGVPAPRQPPHLLQRLPDQSPGAPTSSTFSAWTLSIWLVTCTRAGGWPTGTAPCWSLVCTFSMPSFRTATFSLRSNRVWAVCWPYSYRNWHKKWVAVALCVVGWLEVAVLVLPAYVKDEMYYRLDPARYGCGLNIAEQWTWARGGAVSRLQYGALSHVGYLSDYLVCKSPNARSVGQMIFKAINRQLK